MEQIIKDTTANPAPLGLFGFGMTTILLNIHNAGFFELNAMIMGMGIFFGGLQQVIAGINWNGKKEIFLPCLRLPLMDSFGFRSLLYGFCLWRA